MKPSYEIHCQNLGSLLANFQSIEFTIRATLSELPSASLCGIALGKNIYDYKVGDEFDLCPITDYSSLSELIRAFNVAANKYGWETIDTKLVDIRDALAHGRVAIAYDSNHNPFLMKFSKPSKITGKVTMTFNEKMNFKWFNKYIGQTNAIIAMLCSCSVQIQAIKNG